jgi:hypothetical protein
MSRKVPQKWKRFLPLIALVICIPLALLLFSGLLGERSDQENLAMAEESIRRAAVQCYALEGFYPPSLDYLTDRYGVSVDTKRYFVDYQFVASNLVPDITVLSIGE